MSKIDKTFNSSNPWKMKLFRFSHNEDWYLKKFKVRNNYSNFQYYESCSLLLDTEDNNILTFKGLATRQENYFSVSFSFKFIWNSKDNTYFIKQNGKKTNFAIDTYTKNKKLMGNYIINEFFTIPPKFSI